MTKWTQYWNGFKIAEGESEEVFGGTIPEYRVEKGRAAWAWLHQQCEINALTSEREIAEFRPMIPQYGCACLNDWIAIIKDNPIPLKDQKAWSIRVHNIVNEKLGKPLWPGQRLANS